MAFEMVDIFTLEHVHLFDSRLFFCYSDPLKYVWLFISMHQFIHAVRFWINSASATIPILIVCDDD